MKNIVTKKCKSTSRNLVFILLNIGLFLFSINANAYKNGSIGLSSTDSKGCYCHSVYNNSSLRLTITGPKIITEGQVYVYTITLNQKLGLDLAGINVAFKKTENGDNDSGLTNFDYHLIKNKGELTHKAFPYEKYFSNGIQNFSFKIKAPETPGKYFIQAIGMASNSDCMSNENDIWNWLDPYEIEVKPLVRSLTQKYPKGGENFYSGYYFDIQWYSQNINKVKIELSKDNGISYNILFDSIIGNYYGDYITWNIPNNFEGDNYKIRISSLEKPNIFCENSIPFSIHKKAVELKSNMGNYDICEGEILTLYYKGSGEGSIYTWKWNGINLNINVDSIKVNKSGLYTCEIRSRYGPTLNASALVNVINSKNIIKTQPKDTIISEGSYVWLIVETNIINEPAIFTSYKWYKEGSNTVYSTSKNYGFWAYLADSGSYYCEISTKCDTQRTRSAKVTVIPKTKITDQSNFLNKVCIGKKIEMYVKALGINLQYQWYKNNKLLSGADSSYFIIQNCSISDSGNYYCKVFNNLNKDTVKSTEIKIEFYSQTKINEISKKQEIFVEDTAKFYVIANNDDYLNYQWYKDNKILSGKYYKSMQLIVNSKDDAGLYKCKITNQCNEAIYTEYIELVVKDNPQYPLMRVKKNQIYLDTFFVNETAKTRTIEKVIKNIGLSDLIISDIKISGLDSLAFTLTSPKNLIVKPGEFADFSFTFLPIKKGINKAKLEFISNSPENPSVDITCFLIDINVYAEKDSVYFGLMNEEKAVIINKSNIRVNILSYDFSGRDSLSFKIDTYPIYLESNSKGEIYIFFRNSFKDNYKANLNVKIQYTDKPIIIKLSAGIVWSNIPKNIEDSILLSYPNPATDNISFKLNKIYQKLNYSIYDNNGRIRFKNEVLNSNEIIWNCKDIFDIQCESGIYQILINTGNKIESLRFVIIK